MKVKCLRCDNAGEHEEIFDWSKQHGIKCETTVAGHSQQNGLAERMIQGMEVMARIMMEQAGAPSGFWGNAVRLAAWIYSHTPHSRNPTTTPAFALFKEHTRVDLLHPFGCLVYFMKKDAGKLEAQSLVGAYMGPSVNKRSILVWVPVKHKAVDTLDYKCVETKFAWIESKKNGVSNDLSSFASELSGKSGSSDIDADEDDSVDDVQPQSQPVQPQPQPQPQQGQSGSAAHVPSQQVVLSPNLNDDNNQHEDDGGQEASGGVEQPAIVIPSSIVVPSVVNPSVASPVASPSAVVSPSVVSPSVASPSSVDVSVS